MNNEIMNLSEIKRLRLERHWSQEQLAEMTGLSVRTIQRIERGERAGFESIKALAAVFEIELIVDEHQEVYTKDQYKSNVQRNQTLFKLFAGAFFSVTAVLTFAPKGMLIGTTLATWAIVLGAYSIYVFSGITKVKVAE